MLNGVREVVRAEMEPLRKELTLTREDVVELKTDMKHLWPSLQENWKQTSDHAQQIASITGAQTVHLKADQAAIGIKLSDRQATMLLRGASWFGGALLVSALVVAAVHSVPLPGWLG